jgi:hypothetical protein
MVPLHWFLAGTVFYIWVPEIVFIFPITFISHVAIIKQFENFSLVTFPDFAYFVHTVIILLKIISTEYCISIIEINEFLFILKNLQGCINLASRFCMHDIRLKIKTSKLCGS